MNLALPDGVAYERGDDGYEAARRATVWNARLPDRFPDVIVQAHTEADVGRTLAAIDAAIAACAPAVSRAVAAGRA